MKFNLAVFASLVEEAPGFAIPVFTNSSSNSTYVQNLSPSGAIISFNLFDIGNFFSIPSLAPIVTLQVGDQGILAHWSEDGTVHTGTASELRAVLSIAIINPNSHPFANVERAIFLEDGAQVRNAAKIAARRLSDRSARESYSSRVIQRIEVYQKLRSEYHDSEDHKADSIDDIVLELDNEIDYDRWIDLWVSTWNLHYNNIKLVEAAIRRISSLGLGDEEYDIIDRLRYPTRDEHLPFYKWWLNQRDPSYPGWIHVWVTMSYYSDGINAKKVIAALREAFDNRMINSNQWSLLNAWHRCFYQLPELRSDLVDIISERYNRFYREYLIELVISPITRHIPSDEWANSILRSWFQRVIGSSLWIREFIEQGKDALERSTFERLGILWLRRFGSGTNRWLELYELLEYSMTDDESWLIRVLWLRRAKKDLSSWPVVFESLADSAGPSQFAELSEIAKLWQFRGRHKRSDTTIEDFASR